MNRVAVKTEPYPDGGRPIYGTYHENGGRHPADKNGVWRITEKACRKIRIEYHGSHKGLLRIILAESAAAPFWFATEMYKHALIRPLSWLDPLAFLLNTKIRLPQRSPVPVWQALWS